ncbi:MAG: antibiotic biosynthesis monooxygenase [Hyphomicrobiaceae bacterium]|nr:antibiotic biosynthesis monooxygenase [Hyphomicrobiaceae bacterium]
MQAVIFEFWPDGARKDDYFKVAAVMRAELETAEGFISIERFESITEEGKFVSLSFWESEEAIAAWRNRLRHRAAQAAGRGGIFKDYRLRVASVLRDYTMTERAEAPADSNEAHAGGAAYAGVLEGM